MINKKLTLSFLDLKYHEKTPNWLFVTYPSVTGGADDNSKYILNFFSSCLLSRIIFFNEIDQSEKFVLQSFSPRKACQWNSARNQVTQKMKVILLLMKPKIALLWLNYKGIKIALTNLNIMQYKKIHFIYFLK